MTALLDGPETTGFHSRSTAMDVAACADLRGKVALVTGAASGLGVETVRALASAGADLVLAVRDRDAGEAVADGVRRAWARTVRVEVVDLSDLASVIAFGEAMEPYLPALDLFIANAGVSKTPDSHLGNGLDVRFATNHLGHFVLAHLLRGKLTARGARLVVLSSAAHKKRPIRLEDLQWRDRPRDDLAAYGESKTANILFAVEATRRWSGVGVLANAVLPGSALTGLQRYHGEALKRTIGFVQEDGTPNPAMKSVEQAAATTVWAASAPELAGRGGLVLEDCAEALAVGPTTHPWSGYDPDVIDPEIAVRLWERSLQLAAECGIALDGRTP
jgi:NAD(P)-dependent dehydrogenase (short-subunit alcohol dehydrogenase family)